MSVKAVTAPSEVNADDFHALEEKVYRTIELLKSAREAKAAAERDAARLRAQLEEREEQSETLRSENIALRKEREEVRGRIEKMLKQIEALTNDDSGR
jgi:chromosome segregation ATPase